MKKNGFKRVLAVLLVLTFVLAPMAGCKGKGESKDPADEFVYVPEYVQLPKEITDMQNATCIGDTIYFLSNVTLDADGNVMTQEELDAYYKRMEEYYQSTAPSGGVIVSSDLMRTAATDDTDSGTDVDAADADTADAPIASDPPIADAPAVDTPATDAPMEEITYETRLCAVNKDGTDFRQLSDFVVPVNDGQSDTYISIERIMADAQGNLWTLMNARTEKFNLPADFEEGSDKWEYHSGSESKYEIVKLSETGAEQQRINLTDFVDDIANRDYFYINSTVMDGDGNVYFDDGEGSTLYVISPEGTKLCQIKYEGWINSMMLLSDGKVSAVVQGKEGGAELKTVDIAAKALGTGVKVPTNIYRVMNGGGVYDFCYNDSSSFYGYDSKTETASKIITWINNDIDGDSLSFVDVLENGDLFVLTNGYEDGVGQYFEAVKLVKTPSSEVKQKEKITLAVSYLDYRLRSEILKFNKTNPNYRIEVQDYSQYNTDEDYNAGVTKLNTEIVSGKVPDMIAISNLPYKQYAAKGLLEDLYTYLDNDSELSRDKLVQSVLKASETDGKLYSIAASFGLMSMVGKADVVGAEPGWNMQDLKKLIEDHPEADAPMGMHMSREAIFSYLCSPNMENYIDWNTGECRFDTDEFKNFLEFAKSFPSWEDMDYENGPDWVDDSVLLAEGRMLVSFFNLYDFQSYQYTKASFGDDMVFKGLPVESGVGNVATLDSGLAMTSSCKNKEAAWEFMRTLLTEDYQKDGWGGMPTNQEAFDALLKEAMKQEYYTDENGEQVPISKGGMSFGDGEMKEFYALTQEEADQIIALVDSVQFIADYDNSLLTIIQDEAAAFFADEKSVDEVASIIQSRMNIYINEQR